MAVTLLQYWQQQLGIYQAEQAAAETALARAQVSLAAARRAVGTDQQALAKTNGDIATARAALQDTTIPANAQALIVTITGLLVTARTQQGRLLDDQDAAASAQAAIDAAAATLARAAGQVAGIQATIATVKVEDAQRQALRTAVGASPLATLKADAAASLGSQSLTDATTRLGKNVPAEILAIAKKRHATRAIRLAGLQTVVNHARDARGTGQQTDGGADGLAANKAVAFARAGDTLATYVATAEHRLARAHAVIGLLEAIELDATRPDVLSAPEKTQLAALAALGAAAEPTAEALDADFRAVFTAEDALAAQVLTSIAAHVDAVGADPQIASKQAAIATARTTFTNAVAAFAAANKGDLDRWEAVIPDPAWTILADYEDEIAALNELSALDPTTLVAALDSAENDYATALGAAAMARRRTDHLTDEINFRQGLLEAARAALGARLPSAVRGDVY